MDEQNKSVSELAVIYRLQNVHQSSFNPRKPCLRNQCTNDLTELGDGGTRAEDVNDRPAANVAKPTDAALERHCVEGLVHAAQLQA